MSQDLYNEALKKWTVKVHIYKGLEAVLVTTGTYQSSSFRRAYVNKIASDYHLDTQIRKKMLADEQAIAEKNLEFILAVYAPESGQVRLESRDSMWRIYLEKEDLGRLPPFEVRNLRKQRTRLAEFYPYITPWTQVYRIRFRLEAPIKSTGLLHLVMTGVLGEARLTFDLEG